MIAQLGQLCLHFALLASLVAALLPLCTKLVPSPTLRYIWLRRLCIASWLGVIVAFLALIFSFAIVDNSVFAVAMHAHPMQPLLYRIGATWGHHEGSLLMWNSITATYMLLFLLQPTRNLKIDFTALWVMQVLLLLFLWFQIETSNPLMRVLADHPGRGLNPVLQDPALAIHPPILYAGYLGAIVAFALAIAGLYQRQLGLEWQNWMRNWVRFSWVLLTLGIMLGSMWAYRELGWGGFWFWDPVENASLLPWLLLTVLLHNISITKNDYSGTALLALISFITVLLGAFLVRSGVLSSVHSFTSDPTRGAILLSLTALVFFASMVLYALRASVLTTESSRPYLARILRLQSWVLYAITLSLFLSILLPLYAELVQQRQIMIGLPYFEHSTIPLTLPLLLLMGVANRTSWRVYLLELLAAGIITYLLLLLADPKPWLLVVFVYLAIWTTISTLLARSRLPMTVAHLGFALLVGSIAWTTTQSVEQTQLMQPGTKAEFFGWQLRYDGVKNDMQANYLARQGTVWLSGPNGQTAKLHPEVRFYPIQQQYSVESAITRFALTDVYITIGNIQADGSVTLRFFLRPAMLLVWLGGTLMLVAPLLAWFKRRDIICKNRPNVA